MGFNPEKHHRRSIRMKGYDYSKPGHYFVTICTQNRECRFGQIVNGKMILNDIGDLVKKCLNDISYHFFNMKLDAWVMMPNHIHIIILIGRGTACRAPTVEKFGYPVIGSIPTVIRSFKSAATKLTNDFHETPGSKLWQRNYYEHIIRTETELQTIREYIITNPENWRNDENFRE